jgi:hypothetical protein
MTHRHRRADDVPLSGGHMTSGIVRRGNRLLRPMGPWSPAVHQWAELASADCSVKIEFQRVTGYQPPTWPEGERAQMLHLDFRVVDLGAEHDRALQVGARLPC